MRRSCVFHGWSRHDRRSLTQRARRTDTPGARLAGRRIASEVRPGGARGTPCLLPRATGRARAPARRGRRPPKAGSGGALRAPGPRHGPPRDAAQVAASQVGHRRPDRGSRGGGRPDRGPAPTVERERTDRLDGRLARTVFYRQGGKRIAYTIVSGPGIRAPEGSHLTRRNGVDLHSFDAGGRRVVTWWRVGRTCVLSASRVGEHELLALASWKGDGTV